MLPHPFWESRPSSTNLGTLGTQCHWKSFYTAYPQLLLPSLEVSCSVIKSYLTLCVPMDCSTPGSLSFTISWSLLKLMPIESVMLSNYPIFCCPLLLPSIFPSIRVFSNELALSIRWPKYWSFSFSISPFNEYSGLISFRIDWFDPLQSKWLSRVFSNTIDGKNRSLSTQPFLWSNSHDYWKNHSFDYMDLCLESDISALQYTI